MTEGVNAGESTTQSRIVSALYGCMSITGRIGQILKVLSKMDEDDRCRA